MKSHSEGYFFIGYSKGTRGGSFILLNITWYLLAEMQLSWKNTIKIYKPKIELINQEITRETSITSALTFE